MSGPPSKNLADPIGAGHQRGWVAGATGLLRHLERALIQLLNHAQHFAHGIAVTVAAIECDRGATGTQVVHRPQVGICEVFDVDVVADTCAVGRGIVGPEDRYARAGADRCLAGDFHEQCRGGVGVAHGAPRIAARNVEVAKRHVAQPGCCGQVAQHPFAHELGRTVGVDRFRRGILAGVAAIRDPVDGSSRGEHKVAHTGLVAALQQVARPAGVVTVVLEGLGDRLRHDRMRGEVQNGVDAVLEQQPRDERPVPSVTDDQRRVLDCAAEAGGQIVEYHDGVAARPKLPGDVAADVAGAPGHENRLGHGSRS